VLQGSATSTGDYPLFYNHTGLDNLYIGCATPILRNANASIDQVIIWNRSLSANEIVMLYSNGAGAYNQAHSDATLKGDVWSVTIIANDGFKDGLPLSSNNLSIILTNISINLNLPSNGTIEKSNRRITNNTITFKCSVTNDVNLVNVSLYHNNTGTWHLNITKNVSGTSYKFLESINGISENNFIWNCYACDIDGVCGFSSANYSLIINNTKVDIIPDPQTFTYNINSSFILNNSWQIIYDSNLEYIANTLEILNNSISETLNLSLEQKNKIEFINNYTNISNHSDSNIFLMLYNDSLIGDYFLAEDSQLFNYSLHIGNKGFNQGYLLFSYNNQIFILGNSSQGIYYGMQSLRQIFEDWSNSLYDFNIIDWPDIEYRIFYYVTSENGDDPTIGLQYLENLSRFKMNGVQFSFSGVFAYTKLDTVFIPYTNYSLKNFIRPILTPVWLAQVENGTEGNAIINESFTFNSSNIAVPNLIENNLFYNLDFENGSVGNRPDNWTNISNSIINGQWLITDQANFSGNQSLMLIRNSSSGSASPEMQQTANVSENSYYLVRFKVKTENSSGSGYYQFNLDRLDINSTIIYYDYLQYSADDDGEWHTINIHVAKHSDVRKLRIRMRPVNIYGTIYVDNLNFFRMNAEMINVLTEGGHIFKVTDLLGTTTYVKDRDYTLNKSGSVMATRADTQNITNRVSVNRLPSGNIGINETVLISYDFIFELTASTWQTINPYVNYSFDYVKEFFRNVSKEFNNSGFSSDKFDISLGQDERRGINVDSRSLAQNKENYVTMYLTLNKLYDSCKEIYPYSKIFFWGDMLINYDNGGDIDYQVRWGGKSGATYYASYLLNKSMIIIPWYYHSTDGLKVMRESANFFNNMGIRIAGGAGGNETNIKYWSAMLNNNTLNSYFYGHSVFYAPFSKGETIKYLAEYSWNNYGGDISDLSADNNYELCNGFDDDDDGSIDEDYNLSNDPNHCGTCGNICSYTNALSSCSNGNCQFDACYGDYYNIDNSEINGCEYFCILTNNAVEISDNLDNNCDGSIDEGLMVATLTPTPGTEELLGGSLKNLLPRVSHSILKVLKNTPVYFDFRNKTVVGKIIIITNKDLENVKIEVKEKDSVSNEYSKEVYKYFEIITYQITDDDIVEAEIEFDVEKTWLENNSEAANILLLRYTDSWNELETSLVSEDDNKYYFKAKTPGFSDFAISFKEQEVIEEQEEVVNQKEEVKEEVIEEVKPIIEEKSYTLWYVLGALVLLGVVGLIVFLILRKE
ncbi:MAG: PGF-pre-PGF domain-containing protein, partial [Nanoarchaeota archaeon]|nr:PGF-pre-PGF domain-containing protein [Nanoarchaeota archaeon]